MEDAEEPALLERAAGVLRRAGGNGPAVAVVLGSGLGAFAQALTVRTAVPFSDVPGMPASTVSGHAGEFVLGTLAEVPVVAMCGRVHLYEGHGAQDVVWGVRTMAALGARRLVVTNAAGGIDPEFSPGDLMLIEDHLNLTGCNPLVSGVSGKGAWAAERFVDMGGAYHVRYREVTEGVARDSGLTLRRGVYAGLVGPSYETPAEVRMLARLGADAVGMSTVLEVIAARALGMRVVGLSCITNHAAGVHGAGELSHLEVKETAGAAEGAFVSLLQGLVPALSKEGV